MVNPSETLRNYVTNKKEVDLPKEDISWSSVRLSEVFEKGKRLEATAFNIQYKHVRDVLKEGKFPLVRLYGKNGLIEKCHYPGRFKRIYCEEDKGIPFYLPSQMSQINPSTDKWISPKTKINFDDLRVSYGTLLLTRSGTVGNTTIVTKTLENKIFSDDVIRTRFKEEVDLGYVYAYLKSEFGSNVLKTNQYGSVITHIEPKHLEEMVIPNPPYIYKKKIHDKIIESYSLRDESNLLMEQGTKELINELNLPSIESIVNKLDFYSKEIDSFSVKLSDLKGRLEASYHHPLTKALEFYTGSKATLVELGDKDLCNAIILPGRFSRTYVSKDQGVPFIGGKDLFELISNTGKYLSRKVHHDRLEEELLIKPNSIILPSRGTIGKTMLSMPQQIDNIAISDNLIQVVLQEDIVGYIYAFLNSDYGRFVISKEQSGSVVNVIEPSQLSKVKIPIIKDKNKIKKINEIILRANNLRYKAYQLEISAIKTLNKKILGL